MTAISVARDCEMVKNYEKMILIETFREQQCDNVPRILLENIGEDCDIHNIDFTENVNIYFIMPIKNLIFKKKFNFAAVLLCIGRKDV